MSVDLSPNKKKQKPPKTSRKPNEDKKLVYRTRSTTTAGKRASNILVSTLKKMSLDNLNSSSDDTSSSSTDFSMKERDKNIRTRSQTENAPKLSPQTGNISQPILRKEKELASAPKVNPLDLLESKYQPLVETKKDNLTFGFMSALINDGGHSLDEVSYIFIKFYNSIFKKK